MERKAMPKDEMGHPASSTDAPPPLTSGEIEELERLLEKATPGPWAFDPMEDEWGHGSMLCGGGGRGKYVCHVYIEVKAAARATTIKWQENRRANRDLIAAMRNALPRLLSSLKLSGGSAAQVPPPFDQAARSPAALETALRTLADAADDVGVKFFDTDTMDPVVERMQAATLAARAILSPKEPTDG